MLFGGSVFLYIFLRLGADYHWPIHELNVTMGCFNTAVLIASSVTIVMAWAGVKMRKFAMYFLVLAGDHRVLVHLPRRQILRIQGEA